MNSEQEIQTANRYLDTLSRSDCFPVREAIGKGFIAGMRHMCPNISSPEMSLEDATIAAKQTIWDYMTEAVGEDHSGYLPDMDDIVAITVRHAQQFKDKAAALEQERDRLLHHNTQMKLTLQGFIDMSAEQYEVQTAYVAKFCKAALQPTENDKTE